MKKTHKANSTDLFSESKRKAYVEKKAKKAKEDKLIADAKEKNKIKKDGK